jgi:hypothetical protein
MKACLTKTFTELLNASDGPVVRARCQQQETLDVLVANACAGLTNASAPGLSMTQTLGSDDVNTLCVR